MLVSKWTTSWALFLFISILFNVIKTGLSSTGIWSVTVISSGCKCHFSFSNNLYNCAVVIIPLFCLSLLNSNAVVITSMTTRSITKETQTITLKTFMWLGPIWAVDWLGEGMIPRKDVVLKPDLNSAVHRIIDWL